MLHHAGISLERRRDVYHPPGLREEREREGHDGGHDEDGVEDGKSYQQLAEGPT